MASVNKAILVGHVGNDPVARQFPSGSSYCNFSLATNIRWTNKNTGEPENQTTWHRVVVYQTRLVEIATQYVKRGDLIYVEGTIEKKEYTDNNGIVQKTTDIALRYNGVLNVLTPKADKEPKPEPEPEKPARLDVPVSKEISKGYYEEIPF